MTFYINIMNILDQLIDKAYEKIYNPKTNYIIIINESVYHKLLYDNYMH